MYITTCIRTKDSESYKVKGHPLKNDVSGVVLHHTGYIGDPTLSAVTSQFMNPKDERSSHIVIAENGHRRVFANPEDVTFHAGSSYFYDRNNELKDNVNDFMLGIEFQGDTNKKHLTDAQIQSAVEYLKPIITKYKIPLEHITTHKIVRQMYNNYVDEFNKTAKRKDKKEKASGKPDINEEDYNKIIQALIGTVYYKRNNFQFGGTMNKRKKAIVGKHIEIVDGIPVETSTTYLPNPTYTSPKASLGERIKTGLAESGIGTSDLIGLGVGAVNNAIGLASNLITSKYQKPIIKQAPVLHSTRLVDRVRPYVDSIREQAAKMAYLNDRTAASSRTRFARAQDINTNKNLQETAEVNRADQASIALQNNSLLNQQNIRNQNAINATNVENENSAARTLLHNQKVQDINDSIAQFVNNGNDLINGERGILARKDAKESELRNLATMFAANPYALEAFKKGNYQKALELLKQTRV